MKKLLTLCGAALLLLATVYAGTVLGYASVGPAEIQVTYYSDYSENPAISQSAALSAPASFATTAPRPFMKIVTTAGDATTTETVYMATRNGTAPGDASNQLAEQCARSAPMAEPVFAIYDYRHDYRATDSAEFGT